VTAQEGPDGRLSAESVRHPKYAPANEAGEKPYIVTVWNFGNERDRLVYANDVSTAKWRAVGRRGPAIYAKGCRRALWSEVPHSDGEDAPNG